MGRLICFHCKKPVELSSSSGLPRIGFRDTCPSCHADLHACLNCSLYDEGSHHECRESSAEWVKDKERSNVCEYFRAAFGRAAAADSKTGTLAALDDLFKK